MIGEMLSQDEINALLGGFSEEITASDGSQDSGAVLTPEEIDAIGEIGNISMGTSATTLFTLLNQKVSITTPRVRVSTREEFISTYPENMIAINVDYKEGITGANVLLLKEDDVKKITDIMMGGDGTNLAGDLSELHLSAIAEAMNQMVGSASTSMSKMLDMKIDINPPEAFLANFEAGDISNKILFGDDKIVQVSFDMQIGDIIDSELMQIMPVHFAKEMVSHLMDKKESKVAESVAPINSTPTPPPMQVPTQAPSMQSNTGYQQPAMPIPNMYAAPNNYQAPMQTHAPVMRDVDIQTPEFPMFDTGPIMQQKENMDIIMNVPLEVTVELGRTHKKIKEILEFSPGTIIELDRLAGEPIDILVNGKFVAQGEVVVIDENFGIRVTEIIKQEDRI